MRIVRCLLSVALVCLLLGGVAEATPWFADGFDTYGTDVTPDALAFQAAWSFDSYSWPGDIVYDPPNWLGDPFAWIERSRSANNRARRSLLPAIQAVDPSKNAVQGTATNPLIVKYQMGLGTSASTTDDKVVAWLELVGQEITNGNIDAGFAAPIRNPGSYGTDLGVCDTITSTCTAGYSRLVGKPCVMNSDCDTPIWLDFLPSTTGTCTVLASTLPVPRPSLAFGAYGGTNGLHPKPEPTNNCYALTTNAIAQMVTFDGDQWTRLLPTAPLGASGGSISTSRNTTNVTLTIRETDYDITVEQPVTCDYAGKCDTKTMCISAAAGTCVDNVCSSNGKACSKDADCNFCDDDVNQSCTTDDNCRTYTCEGGIYEGNPCTGNAECLDYSTGLVCIGGSTDGASCTTAANGSLSDTCGPATSTKSHIPRKYTGPFQTVAIGPGRVFDGNKSSYYGSDYKAYIDSIEFSGGEFVALPQGACCLPDDSCVPGVLEAACTQIEGAFYAGDNVTCEQARCNAGACCTDQGCIGEKTQAECEALGGQYQGRGSACDGATCMGACCGPRGTCTDSMITECAGDFRGPGTDCANSTPCCPSPYPDWDGDNDVDIVDFGFLQRCLMNAAGQQLIEPGCSCMDHNHDGLINDVDVTSFIECQTGPGISMGTVPANCAQ